MKTVDCRKMDCPAPVISVKKALETDTELTVLLDDGAPRENVIRFVKNRGFQVTEKKESNYWTITISPAISFEKTAVQTSADHDQVILITSDRLGEGPEELGKLLMRNFIHTLVEAETLPSKIFFMNSGVTLTCEGSELLEAMEKLANLGVEFFSCGLCLDFFGLKDNLRIGNTTNMLTTADTLLSTAKVIKL